MALGTKSLFVSIKLIECPLVQHRQRQCGVVIVDIGSSKAVQVGRVNAKYGQQSRGYDRSMTDESGLLPLWDSQVRFHDLAEALPPDWDTNPCFIQVPQGERLIVVGPPDPRNGGVDVDGLIARAQNNATSRRLELEWHTWGHDCPPELPRRLLAAGFVAKPTEPLLMAVAEEVASNAVSPLPDGLHQRPLTPADDVAAIVTSMSLFCDADPHLDVELPEAVGQGRNQVLIVEAGNQLVATGWVVWKPRSSFAGLAGACTHPDWQRQGIQSRLIVERAKLSRDRGVRYLYSEASTPESERNLRRLGFKFATTSTVYVGKFSV